LSLTPEIIELAPVFFCGAADLALALAGVEAGGLELEAFDLFGGGDVDIVIDGLGVLEAVVEEGGDFDAPAFVLGLDFVLVADADVAGGFGGDAVEFDLPLVAGFGGFGPGLEEADGPEVFVEAELLFCGHIHDRPGLAGIGRRPDDKIT